MYQASCSGLAKHPVDREQKEGFLRKRERKLGRGKETEGQESWERAAPVNLVCKQAVRSLRVSGNMHKKQCVFSKGLIFVPVFWLSSSLILLPLQPTGLHRLS